MKLFFFTLFFFITMSISAQFILAGQYNTNDYYVDIPDTVLNCYGCSSSYPLDLNNDGTIDFSIDTHYGTQLGSGYNYCRITAKDNNQIVLGVLDSCFKFDSTFNFTIQMAKSFILNDSINKNNKWVINSPTMNLGYKSWSGNPPTGFSCSGGDSFGSSESFIGLRVFTTSDTLYGWIDVSQVGDFSCRLNKYACNLMTTGMPNIGNKEYSFEVGPNPVNEKINLFFSKEQLIKTCELYSIDGRLIETSAVKNTLTRQLLIDVSKYAEGVYFIKVNTEEGVAVKKIIVQK